MHTDPWTYRKLPLAILQRGSNISSTAQYCDCMRDIVILINAREHIVNFHWLYSKGGQSMSSTAQYCDCMRDIVILINAREHNIIVTSTGCTSQGQECQVQLHMNRYGTLLMYNNYQIADLLL